MVLAQTSSPIRDLILLEYLQVSASSLLTDFLSFLARTLLVTRTVLLRQVFHWPSSVIIRTVALESYTIQRTKSTSAFVGNWIDNMLLSAVFLFYRVVR